MESTSERETRGSRLQRGHEVLGGYMVDIPLPQVKKVDNKNLRREWIFSEMVWKDWVEGQKDFRHYMEGNCSTLILNIYHTFG